MNWKLIVTSLGHADMRKRILAVLGILLVFRVLGQLPIPLGNPETLRQVLDNVFNGQNTPQLLSFFNTISGGAMSNFSIMIAGMGPFINASIIMQLLTKAIPKLEELRKDGETGQKKINQYTRIITFPLAIVQSIGAIYLVRQSAEQLSGVDITANSNIMQWVVMVAALTGGSMLLMWLGELITEQSVGNGISLIITVGIVSRLPQTFSSIGSTIFGHANHWKLWGKDLPINEKNFWIGMILLGSAIIVTWLVVKLNEASRNLTVNYAKRVQGNRTYGGVTTVLPVKLITAGVVPIIFAVAFLSVPSFAGQIMKGMHSAHLQQIGANLVTWFQAPSSQTFAAGGYTPWIYPVTYFLLVFVFTFFYTSITFNSKEIAENLHKQGGFIEGVRSGQQTEKYLSKVVNRLTLFGAISLGVLALLPIIAQVYVQQNIAIGGTSILILVSVSLQTLRAVESRALMVTYDQYSQPEFFYDPTESEAALAQSGRLRFAPFRRGKKSK